MNDYLCGGFEKMSLLDYEGKIACTLFLNGCNFMCPWCHNSSLISFEGDEVDLDEFYLYLEKRKNILEAVCISGGEPTLNPNLKKIIRRIKNIGYLVKLDTNGTNPQVLRELINEKLIDYIAMDIKNDENNYPKTIGLEHINFKNIKESINIIMNSNIEYEFRTTLVKELHTEENIINIKELIKGANKYYLQKFILRESCLNQSLNEIDINTANHYKNILSDSIKNVYLRGY